MISKASRVTPKCSMAGIARPRKTISRSPNGFVLCSEDPKSSADNLMMVDCLWLFLDHKCFCLLVIVDDEDEKQPNLSSSLFIIEEV